ncbi:hypothetical protein AVEN_147449-1, partial [Araneus ventricosus]
MAVVIVVHSGTNPRIRSRTRIRGSESMKKTYPTHHYMADEIPAVADEISVPAQNFREGSEGESKRGGSCD